MLTQSQWPTDLEPCWSWENSTTWFTRSLSWRLGMRLLRKSSNSRLLPVTSFDRLALEQEGNGHIPNPCIHKPNFRHALLSLHNYEPVFTLVTSLTTIYCKNRSFAKTGQDFQISRDWHNTLQKVGCHSVHRTVSTQRHKVLISGVQY